MGEKTDAPNGRTRFSIQLLFLLRILRVPRFELQDLGSPGFGRSIQGRGWNASLPTLGLRLVRFAVKSNSMRLPNFPFSAFLLRASLLTALCLMSIGNAIGTDTVIPAGLATSESHLYDAVSRRSFTQPEAEARSAVATQSHRANSVFARASPSVASNSWRSSSLKQILSRCSPRFITW